MLGDNPKRPPIFGDGLTLYVQKIFKTLQGEGPNVGCPAVFVRLGGCNLACEFCDTEFENYNSQKLAEIITSVQDYSGNVIKLVVITGGEPLRQPIEALCQRLIDLGYIVQIETNGTIYRKLPREVEIICSPKVVNNKYLKIREEFLPRLTAIKFLISDNIKTYSWVPELGQTEYKIPVFLQAIDQYNPELNKANKSLAVKLALEYGHRLSYQIHKELEIE